MANPPPTPVAAPVVGVQHLLVDAERAGQRLDNFLFNRLRSVPKTHVYRLLRTGQLRVNGKRAKPEQKLVESDDVRIPPLRIADPDQPQQASESALRALSAQIVFEDRQFLALDKPSGLASHGGSGIKLGAIERMRQLRPEEELELVHRLDRDTSGVLLFARRHSALRAVQTCIREGRVRKRYLALLAGHLPREKVVVDVALQKSILRGGERMVEVDADGKPSRSVFTLIERFADADFVEVRIETGRTHQIRVHSAHLGAPVAGDPKYGDAERNRSLKSAGLKRLFLHAAEFAFSLPGDGGEYCLKAELPDELQAVLQALRRSRDG